MIRPKASVGRWVKSKDVQHGYTPENYYIWLVNRGPRPSTKPPPEMKVSFSALRETNGFRKPLIRPAISRGGTSRGGWLTGHKTNIYITKKEPFQKDPPDPDPKKNFIFQVL